MSVRLLLIVAVVLSASVVVRAEESWTSLFDGKNLVGWESKGGHATYRAEDGMIIGKTGGGQQNSFLCRGAFADFELEFDVLCDKQLNSGVQIRSQVYEKDSTQGERVFKAGRVYGYQCEIATAAEGTCGNFYDEARRTKWLDDFSNKPQARSAFKDNEWNHYRIVAQGNHIRSWVNGVPCADFHDDLDASGFIGLQVHSLKKGEGGPYQVRFKNIRIRELKPGDKVE